MKERGSAFSTAVAVAALVGLPQVAAGLLIWLLLSRSGPLGPLGRLFAPTAMVIAQAVLIRQAYRQYRGCLPGARARHPAQSPRSRGVTARPGLPPCRRRPAGPAGGFGS